MKTEVTTPDVELVRSFVNTLDREDGIDVLDRGWLVDHGLLPRGEEPELNEIRTLVDVREAIRTLLRANNGLPVDRAGALAVLDDAGLRVRLAVRFSTDGTVALQPEGAPAERATGSILAAVARLTGSDAWARLKACRWEDCGWAFYDEARNRSRAWCSMAACGNRAKARAYRARH
jgi:predicted RNA-binding Zn ribbon-like protein